MADLTGHTVEDLNGGDELADLRAVGADVLDRGRTDRPGDPGQRFESGETEVEGMGDERVPVLPRLGGHPGVGRRGLGGLHSGGPDHADRAVEPGIGDEQIRSAADEQDVRLLLTAESERMGGTEVEQFVASVRDGDLRGRSAETEGGERGQFLRVDCGHAETRTCVRLRTSASPDFTVMSMRAVPTAGSTAPTVAVSLSEVVGVAGDPVSASGTTTGAEKRVR